MSVHESIEKIKIKMTNALERSGRAGEEVTLVTVTKTVDTPKVQEALEAGIRHIGENRVQEAGRKIEAFQDRVDLTWHMIGHLQTNKVKRAVELFHVIHSVDSLRLAQEIHKRAIQQEKIMPILFEVNVSEETSKFGLSVQDLLPVVRETSQLEGIALRGLMTMAPFVEDPEETRPCFRRLREALLTLQAQGFSQMVQLSMGMTNDFEVAIEEGATIVRIGSAIFGERA